MVTTSPNELAAYPAEVDALLDRVFDEYGLIVCGWSADWDVALRAAISRAPARHYRTYWASRGQPSDAAADLIARRGGQLIPIADADTFFAQAAEQVESLAEFSRPHPLSTSAAVASLKRYLSEPRFAIQLSDLIHREIERAQAVFHELPMNIGPIEGPNIE